jgi:hypothetical protein
VEQSVVRYTYYQNPKKVVSKEKFRRKFGVTVEDLDDLYEQYLISAEYKNHFSSLRYDYNIKLYKKMTHSSSHLHIGPLGNVCIPSDHIIDPYSFMINIVYWFYPDVWVNHINNNSFEYISISDDQFLSSNIFTDLERKNLFLSRTK